MEITISRDEVLRYLGYRHQRPDDETELFIGKTIDEVGEIIKPRYTYKIFDIKKEDNRILLKSTNVILHGKHICKHLHDAFRCALMAVTLGPGIDEKIRLYNRVDMTKAVVFDAVSAAAVEGLCDSVSSEIKVCALNEGLFTTTRFSPGYGDLPLNIQPMILNTLDAQKKIGLTNTEDFILIPQKSVTAVIGFVGRKHTET